MRQIKQIFITRVCFSNAAYLNQEKIYMWVDVSSSSEYNNFLISKCSVSQDAQGTEEVIYLLIHPNHGNNIGYLTYGDSVNDLIFLFHCVLCRIILVPGSFRKADLQYLSRYFLISRFITAEGCSI